MKLRIRYDWQQCQWMVSPIAHVLWLIFNAGPSEPACRTKH